MQFIGCMNNVFINNKEIDLHFPGDDVIKEKNIAACTSCKPNPCKNNGSCVEKLGMNYVCKCLKNYYGGGCENSRM